MASGPMQKCCISGSLHDGIPTGEVKTIADTSAYISYPPDKSTHYAILLLTDALGYKFPNTRLIADQLASAGYLTIVPDLFNGSEVPFPVPEDFDLQNWIDTTMPQVGIVDSIIKKVIKHLREDMGIKRLGGVGYCFGGKYTCRWLKEGEGKLDVGFTAHPSFVDSVEVEELRGPLSIAAAETDKIFTVAKRHETEEILAKLTVPYQIFLYSDVEHGFAVKGHMSTAKARFAKEQAFLQAVAWFDQYLKEV